MNSKIGISVMVAVVLLANACVRATPSGYYREQHEYEKNEERYVNGELQHSSKDAEFLARQGELAAVTVSAPVKHHFRHHEEYNKNKEERDEAEVLRGASHAGEHDSRDSLMRQMHKSERHENEWHEQALKQQPPVFYGNAASAAASQRAHGELANAKLSMPDGRLLTPEERALMVGYLNGNGYGEPPVSVWPSPTVYMPAKELSSGRKAAHIGRVGLQKDFGLRQPYKFAPNTVVDEAAAAQLTQQCYQAWKVYSNEEMNRKLRESSMDAVKQQSLQRMEASDAKAAAERAQQYRYSQQQQYSASSYHSASSQ